MGLVMSSTEVNGIELWEASTTNNQLFAANILLVTTDDFLPAYILNNCVGQQPINFIPQTPQIVANNVP